MYWLLGFIYYALYNQLAFTSEYPSHWWEFVPENERISSWEILPHEANKGELILSKRNELGQFSNLAHTPFYLDGIYYASIEGLWQGLKYPDTKLVNDQRFNFTYPLNREEVYLLFDFKSKEAGKIANKINKKNKINFVSYKGYAFDYKDMNDGSNFHYKLIKRAIMAKLKQNPHLIELLMQTKGLKLKADHKQKTTYPKAYYYHQIYMEIRDSRVFEKSLH